MTDLEGLERTKKVLSDVSDSFCLAKWKTATLHLHNGNTQSCHHVKSHRVTLDPQRPSSLHNTPQKMQARAEMLAGKRPSECSYCWRVEDVGEISDRIHKSSEPICMDYLKEVLDGQEGPHINPSMLEISFDHKCQFKCMYCSPAYSTTWEKEVKEFGDYPTVSQYFVSDYNRPLPKNEKEKYIDTFWKWWQDLRQSLEFIRVTGGEPLLSKETYRLMDDLIANPQPDIQFGINTNMGLNQQQLEVLTVKLNALQETTGSVILFTSIDNCGPQAEYIRYGLDYDRFMHNLIYTLENVKPPLVIGFMVTVNLLSLSGLKDLLVEIEKIKKRFPQHYINVDTPFLRNPQYMSVEILPEDFRHYAEEAADFVAASDVFIEAERLKVRRLIPLIGDDKLKNPAKLFLLRRDLYRFITEYDKRRGTDFSSTFPEYVDFLQRCQSPMRNFQDTFLKSSMQRIAKRSSAECR
jgi:hypothetical protein